MPMIVTATTPSVCPRCGEQIHPGQAIFKSNLSGSSVAYHPKTADGSCDVYQGAERIVPNGDGNGNGKGHGNGDSVALDVLADAVAHRLDGRLGVNEATVQRLLNEALANIGPRPMRITWNDGGAIIILAGEHYLAPRVANLMRARFHVVLWGPAGTGKTTMALNLARAMGRYAEIDTWDPSTPKSSILAYRTPDGTPVTTAFVRCYGNADVLAPCDEPGGVYVADECDLGPAQLQSLMNSSLANGHAPFPWGNVPRGRDFAFLGTCNTPMRKTDEFPDRQNGSNAFKDRLYFVHVPQDPNIERRAVGLPEVAVTLPERTTCSPAEWYEWVVKVREFAPRAAIKGLFYGQRATLEGQRALAIGESVRDVADAIVFKGADAAIVDKVLDACPLPGHVVRG